MIPLPSVCDWERKPRGNSPTPRNCFLSSVGWSGWIFVSDQWFSLRKLPWYRVKEEVYRPDWTSTERLDYTLLLFDLLEKLLPRGAEGSVSTLPGSFKEFIANQSTPKVLFQNLIACATRMEKIARAKSLDLHLGLEPEPLGLFETIPETLDFFDALREESKGMEELTPRIESTRAPILPSKGKMHHRSFRTSGCGHAW